MTTFDPLNGAGGVPAPVGGNGAAGGCRGVRHRGANPHEKRDSAAGGIRHLFVKTLPPGQGACVAAPDRRGSGGVYSNASVEGGRQLLLQRAAADD